MKNSRVVMIAMLVVGAMILVACGGQAQELAPTVAAVVQEVAPTVAAVATEAAAPEPTMAPEPTTAPEPTMAPEATEAPAEGGATTLPADAPKLVIWADELRQPVLESLEGPFEAENGVDLVIEELEFGDIRSQLVVAGPAGEGPDIIVGAHDWLGELVSSGVLSPVDLGDKVSDFAPAAIQAFSYDGELYGLPTATENIALFINTDLVPECPATWTEVHDISAELAANNTSDVDTNQYGFVRMEGDPYHFFPIQTAFGGYVFGLNDDGSYNPADIGIGNEGSVAAGEWYANMIAEGLQPPAVDGEIMVNFFETGKSAMTITGPWNLARIKESGIPYEICPIPDETANGAPFLGSQGFMISAFSKNPLLAQIFLTDYIATPEAMQTIFDTDGRTPAYLPVLEGIDDPDIKAFGAAGEGALPMPSIPEMSAVWEAWGNAVTLIAQGGATAADAFTTAQTQIETAIAGGG